jgi:hypothetical protein
MTEEALHGPVYEHIPLELREYELAVPLADMAVDRQMLEERERESVMESWSRQSARDPAKQPRRGCVARIRWRRA